MGLRRPGSSQRPRWGRGGAGRRPQLSLFPSGKAWTPSWPCSFTSEPLLSCNRHLAGSRIAEAVQAEIRLGSFSYWIFFKSRYYAPWAPQ